MMDSASKILVFTENAQVRQDLEKALEGSYACTFWTGDHPIEKVFDEVPHLIVIDENYQNNSGREVALYIKKDLVLKYIPILLIASDHDLDLLERRWKIDFYFTKDQGIKNIAPFIQRVLTQSCHELDFNPLTHLPGLRSSVLRIERFVNSQKPFAVCYIDLTDLAAYNNVYGVLRGDEVIVRLSRLIQDAMRREGLANEFVGHLGGDDFVVVTESEDLAVHVSESLIRLFDEMIPNLYSNEDKKQGFISVMDREGIPRQYPMMNVSIAVVYTESILGCDVGELGYIAGELKKKMKTIPGSCYVKYHYRMAVTASDEALPESLEATMPGAMKSVRMPSPTKETDENHEIFKTILEKRKIKTVYQPLYDFRKKIVVGYEALTRTLPHEKIEEPLLLFGLAREVGRVKELDRLCVEVALQMAQTIKEGQKLFINLNHETLIDTAVMKDLFKRHGDIAFKNIVIEVTEQSILRSFHKMKEALGALKDQGVSIAIDDLGGGAVSLRDVAVLRPDYIKFDKSLIRQIDTNITKQQIILSMILFAKGIQAVTCAEGIETREEFHTVQILGINLAQGFYIARPGDAFPVIADFL